MLAFERTIKKISYRIVASWRWRTRPIARRVTGSTRYGSGQYSSVQFGRCEQLHWKAWVQNFRVCELQSVRLVWTRLNAIHIHCHAHLAYYLSCMRRYSPAEWTKKSYIFFSTPYLRNRSIYRWCTVVSVNWNMMNQRSKMSHECVARTTVLHLFCRMTNH